MKNRVDIINHLIKKMGYKEYLEVGVYKGEVFNTIKINKTGVDLDCDIDNVLNMSSNDFFEDNSNLYDLIFIDGDHNYNQVKLDVENALSILTPNGMVVMHDTCPTKRKHVEPKKDEIQEWCGESFKVAAEYNKMDGFSVITWAQDFGVTIIRTGNDYDLISFDYDINFYNLLKYKYEMVNAQSIEAIESSLYNWNEVSNNIKNDINSKNLPVIPLKEYYKSKLPDKRIGRKGERTLISELKDAGFDVSNY